MYSDIVEGLSSPHLADILAWPSEITRHKASRTLGLVWGGMQATVPHKTLRQSCRGADRESRRRNDKPITDDVELSRIEPISDIGLQFVFSDGHQRGIFPWAYLYQLAF